MKNIWIAIIIFLFSSATYAINQECSNCVQVDKNIGVINVEGRDLFVRINRGEINILGSPDDKNSIRNYETKVINLEEKINGYLSAIEKHKQIQLVEYEKIERATKYAQNLVDQIALLDKRIAYLDKQNILTKKIIAAKDEFDVALIKDLLKQKQKLDDRTAAETAFELAGFQKIDLEYEDSIQNYIKAVSLDPNNPLYLSHTSKLFNYLGDYENALKYAEKALSINENANIADISKIADGMRDLGSIYQNLGVLDKAVKYYDGAIKIAGKNPGTVSAGIILAVFNDKLTALLDMGEYSLAIKGLKATYESSIEIYGKDSEQPLGLLQNIGTAYLTTGDVDKAIQYLEATWKKRVKIGARFRPEDLSLRSNISTAYRQKEKYDIAQQHIIEAISQGLEHYKKEHPKILSLRREVGLIHQDKGEHGIASDVFVLVLEDWFKITNETNLDIAKLYGDLAHSIYMIGRTCDSIMLYKKAYNFYIDYYGVGSNKITTLKENIEFLESLLSKNDKEERC